MMTAPECAIGDHHWKGGSVCVLCGERLRCACGCYISADKIDEHIQSGRCRVCPPMPPFYPAPGNGHEWDVFDSSTDLVVSSHPTETEANAVAGALNIAHSVGLPARRQAAERTHNE